MSAQSVGDIGAIESARALAAPDAQKSVALRQSATLLILGFAETRAATENPN
jgi:hypothetical protein